jgi:hypothetical protein
MKYCRITTENHPVSLACPDCIEDISALLLKEGHITLFAFTNDEVVLNLDCVETLLALKGVRDKRKSMDMTFGIANDDRSVQLMVLVELKLNHLNPNNVKRDFLEQKVIESTAVLSNSIHIYANYIFLFRSDRKEEAKNRFFRMNPKIPNEYLVMDVEELYDTFF